MTVHPAKTQISLGIRPVWSESLLCASLVAKDPSFLHADSEDSDQTGRMPRLIWVFAGRTLILLVLSCRVSYSFCRETDKGWYLRNKFLFSDIHQGINAMGLAQSKRRPKGVTLTLRVNFAFIPWWMSEKWNSYLIFTLHVVWKYFPLIKADKNWSIYN